MARLSKSEKEKIAKQAALERGRAFAQMTPLEQLEIIRKRNIERLSEVKPRRRWL